MFRLHFTPVMSWAKRNAWCDCLVQCVISTFCKHNAAKMILEKFSIQRVWACLGGAGTNFAFLKIQMLKISTKLLFQACT